MGVPTVAWRRRHEITAWNYPPELKQALGGGNDIRRDYYRVKADGGERF
jgi:hypothetical protein